MPGSGSGGGQLKAPASFQDSIPTSTAAPSLTQVSPILTQVCQFKPRTTAQMSYVALMPQQEELLPGGGAQVGLLLLLLILLHRRDPQGST